VVSSSSPWNAPTTGTPDPDYREQVQAPLTSPLVASASYLVEFHVSLAGGSMVAIDKLGQHLSVGALGTVRKYAPLAVTPQTDSPGKVHPDGTAPHRAATRRGAALSR
jgi:hypothetical protein